MELGSQPEVSDEEEQVSPEANIIKFLLDFLAAEKLPDIELETELTQMNK